MHVINVGCMQNYDRNYLCVALSCCNMCRMLLRMSDAVLSGLGTCRWS